jgi:hypothetical protein
MTAPAIPDAVEYMQISAALAMELASGMSSPKQVFARHGFTEGEARQILGNPHFKKMLKEAKANWDGDNNAEERIRLKAKLALEELLLPHYLLAKSPDTPANARNEAIKTFERLSGLARDTGDNSTGERFVVNINLGDAPEEKIVIDAPVTNEGVSRGPDG